MAPAVMSSCAVLLRSPCMAAGCPRGPHSVIDHSDHKVLINFVWMSRRRAAACCCRGKRSRTSRPTSISLRLLCATAAHLAESSHTFALWGFAMQWLWIDTTLWWALLRART